MTTPIDVIALIRVSTAEQAQGDRTGIERQRTANLETAQRNGLRIRREVVAKDVSGRHVREDPQFKRIFAELTDPTLAGVVVAEQSRLIRPEAYGDVVIFDYFAQNKKLIFTPGEVVDPNTPAGRMSLGLRAMMSREELITLRYRMEGGKREKRERGQSPGGYQSLPRTVRYVKEYAENSKRVIAWRWELVPIEADRIRLAFELLLEGDSYALIVEKIGGSWTETGLRTCLKNPIHIGIRRYAYKAGPEFRPKPTEKNPDPQPRRRSVRQGEVYDIPTRLEVESGTKPPIVTPLVSLATFDRAQAIMAERMVRWRRAKERNIDRDRFLGLGTVQCSCGQRLYGRYGGRGPHLDRYYCSTAKNSIRSGCGAGTIRRSDLDTAIEESISMLADDAFIEAAVDAMLAEDDAGQKSEEELRYRAALRKLENGRKGMLEALSDGDITAEQYKFAKLKNEREVKALSLLIPIQRPKISAREIAMMMLELFRGFGTLPYMSKRTLLRTAIGSVTVDGHGKAIVSVTVQGGCLGKGVKMKARSTASTQFDSVPDLVFRFPQPVVIPDTYKDRRAMNGLNPASLATRFAAGSNVPPGWVS